MLPTGEYKKTCCINFLLYSPGASTVLGGGFNSVSNFLVISSGSDSSRCSSRCCSSSSSSSSISSQRESV